jgi:hypothetical protein
MQHGNPSLPACWYMTSFDSPCYGLLLNGLLDSVLLLSSNHT